MAKLFFDTETTGLINRRASATDSCQPNLAQIAAILYDDAWVEIASMNYLVYPEGWEIPVEASNIHGITTEKARKYGVSLKPLVYTFCDMVDAVDTIVCHNAAFDTVVMKRAAHIIGESNPFEGKNEFCTMLAATPIAKILHKSPRNDTDFKYPKLEECMQKFFGEKLEGAHDALVDIRATVRVYRYLCEVYNIAA